jgi:hypothetical protein
MIFNGFNYGHKPSSLYVERVRRRCGEDRM